jgi:lipopolysaccharide/colanic/teichoic acid biosynthesis glycosyltransferase
MQRNDKVTSLFSRIPGTARSKGSGLLDEERFSRALSIERKRAERSGQSLLLTIIDITQIVDPRLKDEVFSLISGSIPALVRETDVCGWLRNMVVPAIIFTEIPRHAVAQAIDTVERKVSDRLRAVLDDTSFSQIRLSVLQFPVGTGGGVPEEEFNPLFYPELASRTIGEMIGNGLKRLMDIAGAVVGLVLFSPVFIVVPAVIRLTSPGPVFFRQKRLGQYGRVFTFLKFRSMKVNNDDAIHRQFIRDFIANKDGCGGEGSDGKVFKIRHDPRLTPIGSFLRKTSIDELPQFINVLRGDMSLVGPRPPIPYELENYDIWHRFRILGKRPGITGLWQVRGRSLTTFDGMVRLDLQYIRHWSLWLDIRLLLETPLAVIRGKGAY